MFTAIAILSASLHATASLSVRSEATQPKARSVKRLSLSLTSFYYGPPIGELGSKETAASRAGYTLGLSIQNQLALRYRLSPALSVIPVFDFEYQLTDPHNAGANEGFVLSYDSYIKLRHSKLTDAQSSAGRFTLGGDVRYYVPTSEFSRANDSPGSVRATLTPHFQFKRSRFSIGMLTFARYWIQTQTYQVPTRFNPVRSKTTPLPQLTLYAGPQVTYDVTDRVAAWLLFEGYLTIDTIGVTSAERPGRSLYDIEPGVDFQVTRQIYVSPYLNWYTNQPLSTVSLNITARFTI
jgi:hypothetical protein